MRFKRKNEREIDIQTDRFRQTDKEADRQTADRMRERKRHRKRQGDIHVVNY